MINLLEAMRTIEQKKRELKQKTEDQMKAYNEAYQVLWDLNEACNVCNGEGKRLRARACAEDDAPDPKDPRDWIKCERCNGTGIVRKLK